jgi:AcrR family transcriptional regulator
MKTLKRQPRPNAPDRLNEIYEVAARIIREKGYDGASMSEIADAVGITKAGIYHYIPGKQDLLFAVMSYGMDSLDNDVIGPARAISDPEQRLNAIITNHVNLIAGHSTAQGNPITIVVDEVAGLTPAHRRKINQRKRAYVDLVRDTLKQLKDAGKLKDLDITAAAFSLFGMILWISRWYRPDGRLTPEQVAKEVCKMALGGLLRPQARLGRR